MASFEKEFLNLLQGPSLEPVLRDLGLLASPEMEALHILKDHPEGLTLEAFIKERGESRGKTVMLVASLRNKGYLERRKDSRDVFILIGKKGRSEIEKLEKRALSTLSDAFVGMSEKDKAALLEILKKIDGNYGGNEDA